MFTWSKRLNRLRKKTFSFLICLRKFYRLLFFLIDLTLFRKRIFFFYIIYIYIYIWVAGTLSKTKNLDRRGYRKKINLLKISRFPDFIQYLPDFSQYFPDFYNVSPIFQEQKFLRFASADVAIVWIRACLMSFIMKLFLSSDSVK